MRSEAFGKVYRSFEEFERDELRKLDGIHLGMDDMMNDMFGESSGDDVSHDELAERRTRRGPGRPRKVR